MAQTPAQALTRNIRLALYAADADREELARQIGVSRRTFYRRLSKGQFTVPDLTVIAKATDTTLLELIPAELKASR